MVDLLIEHGAHVAARDKYNRTPLHLAACKGHKEIVDLLIRRRADVSARNEEGRKEVVDLLIEHGAHVAARDECN